MIGFLLGPVGCWNSGFELLGVCHVDGHVNQSPSVSVHCRYIFGGLAAKCADSSWLPYVFSLGSIASYVRFAYNIRYKREANIGCNGSIMCEINLSRVVDLTQVSMQPTAIGGSSIPHIIWDWKGNWRLEAMQRTAKGDSAVRRAQLVFGAIISPTVVRI